MRSSSAAEAVALTAALGLCSALLVATLRTDAGDREGSAPPSPPVAQSPAPSGLSPVPPTLAPAPSIATPGSTAGVAGRVLDAAGRPVAGAVVLIRALATETPAGWLRAISDATGMFRVLGLPPGFYALVATVEPLLTSATEKLPLLADATARIDLVLDAPTTI